MRPILSVDCVPIMLSFIHPESYYLQNPRVRYPQKILGFAIGEEYILCTEETYPSLKKLLVTEDI